MQLNEQYNTVNDALGQCMVLHACAVMRAWVRELDEPLYYERINELEQNYKQVFDWFLVQDDLSNDEQLEKLTAKAFLLTEEIYQRMCALRHITYMSYGDFEQLMGAVDLDQPAQAAQILGHLFIYLIHYDYRIDFFPQMQDRVVELLGDGNMAFEVLCALVESTYAASEQLKIPEEQSPFAIEQLPETWLYEVIIGDDEERKQRMARIFLSVGRMDLMWEELEEADAWLVKRLRTGKARARDYMNYGHCCWLLRSDRLTAYENYLQARRMCPGAKEFFTIFRPDRKQLADHGVPLEHIYFMEDQLLSDGD